MAGAAAILVVFVQPETIHYKRAEELRGLPRPEKVHKMWQWLNPLRIIRLYRYPNLLTVVSICVTIAAIGSLIRITGISFVLSGLEHVLTSYTYPLRS